jgi:hypothetical protein
MVPRNAEYRGIMVQRYAAFDCSLLFSVGKEEKAIMKL